MNGKEQQKSVHIPARLNFLEKNQKKKGQPAEQ